MSQVITVSENPSVEELLSKVHEVAELNQKRDKSKKTQDATSLQINEVIRQGDVNLGRLEVDFPCGKQVQRTQLADGFSIGARHCLDESTANFQVFEMVQAPDYVKGELHRQHCKGYVVKVLHGTVLLTHPEHDNFIIGEPTDNKDGREMTVIGVTYQLDPRTKERLLD